MRGWADVGLWVAVSFLVKISLHRPTSKTTFARLTQSHDNLAVISRFFNFQIKESYDFFSFFETLFLYKNYRFLYHAYQKISCWRISSWRAVRFEINMFCSGMNYDCIWRPISIHYVQIEPGVKSDIGNGLLGQNSWPLACRAIFSLVHVDWRRWRSKLVWSHQLTSALKSCLLFWKGLRWSSLKVVSVPTPVIGGLRGFTATSNLGRCLCVCVCHNEKSARWAASTTSGTGDTSSKQQQQAQRKENYN